MLSRPLISLLLPIVATTKALIPPLSPQESRASHLLQLPHNSSLAAANPTLTYHVPETQTILSINYFPHFQIPREDLMTAIRKIRNRMNDHIRDKGDGWLLSKDDPILETIPEIESQEWDIIIESTPVTVRLTYGVVLEVLEGWENLIDGPVGPCQMFAAIENMRRGLVGRLRMFRPRDIMDARELL